MNASGEQSKKCNAINLTIPTLYLTFKEIVKLFENIGKTKFTKLFGYVLTW